MSAKKRWAELSSDHDAVLRRARRNSRLTIPGLIPEEGQSSSTMLTDPFQSLGSRGVNNLASKLLLALFPPNTAFFRLQLPDEVLVDLGAQRSEAENALVQLESRGVRKMESAGVRNKLFQVLKHLIVAGTALVKTDSIKDLRFWRLDEFRMVRDPMGRPLESVICEDVPTSEFSQEDLVAAGAKPDAKSVTVYTMIRWDHREGRVKWHQEVNQHVIEETRSDVTMKKSPWWVPRWTASDNENYGRSHVDEYVGDLISYEAISEAIVSFAEVAARVIFLRNPNGTTDETDLVEAETGDFVDGLSEDISLLQVEKGQDFQVAQAVGADLQERLSAAFLLNTGQIRNAERVTAEEVRLVAQELEDALGGVFTVLVDELVQPLVGQLLSEIDLPSGLRKHVTPIVVTGFEALGRNHTVQRLRAFIGDVAQTLGPQVAAQWINVEEALKRLGSGHGIEDFADLVKSQDEVNEEQQAAAARETVQRAAPGVAQEVVSQGLQQ